MRVIANPGTRRSAHLTLRGPYKEPLSAAMQAEVAAVITGARIVVGGAGSFFGPSQQTVFIGCEAAVLRSVWDKPGLGYTPHLTVYDGDDSDFASNLLVALETHPFRVHARLDGLEEMEVGAPSAPGSLLERGIAAWSAELLGDPIDGATLFDLDQDARIALIVRVAERLGSL